MTADTPGIPDGPIDQAPVGFLRTAEQAALLRQVLAEAGVELGPYDERIVAWLATWPWSTVGPVLAWIKQAGAGSSGLDNTRQTCCNQHNSP